MMAAKLTDSRNTRRGMQIIRNIKLILLSFHERFLNFSENIGISDTNSHENRQTKYKKVDRMTGCRRPASHARLPLKNPRTSVCRNWQPTKELVCRVSLLNLAKRSAEKTEIKNAA